MKILDRYLLRELAGPFLFGLGIFILFFVAGDVLIQILRSGMSLKEGIYFLVLSLPSFLTLVIPMASLLAVLMTVGRLSAESELVAMHAAGFSFPRLTLPFVAAGLFLSLLAFGLNETVVPWSQGTRQDLVLAATRSGKVGQKSNVLFEQRQAGGASNIVAARELKLSGVEQQMRGVTITQLSEGRPVAVISADYGTWNGRTWVLHQVTTHLLSAGDSSRARVSSDLQEIDFGATPEEIQHGAKDPSEMSYRELRAKLKKLVESGQKLPVLLVELQRKLSLPFATLVFMLIGAPLALRSPRGGSGMGIGLTMIIAFVFYLFWQQLTVMAQSGALSPVVAAWLPNALFACIGIGLIFSVKR